MKNHLFKYLTEFTMVFLDISMGFWLTILEKITQFKKIYLKISIH